MPDPFTEIREAPADVIRKVLRDGCQEGSWDRPCAKCAAEALAALERLEREAAERETALAEWKEPWRIIAVNDVPFDGDLHLTPATVVARLKELQARVREVQDERDALVTRVGQHHNDRERAMVELARAEATVARQAETLRDVRGKVYGQAGRWCNEVVRLIDAVLASPEAAAAEPTEWERPLEVGGILWLAAIDRVPIEERIEWVARMKLRVAEINAHRAALAAAALPAVDAPPEPTT